MYVDEKDVHGFKYNGKVYCKKCARYYGYDAKTPLTHVLTESVLDNDHGEYYCDACKAPIHERTNG